MTLCWTVPMAPQRPRLPIITTTPDIAAPSLHCPSCHQLLGYRRTILSGVHPLERWDEFTCHSCGPFEYRHRTRHLRPAMS
jgi:hypothetical protein